MKKNFKRIISIILALVMLMSALSCCLVSFAEEDTAFTAPGIETLLTDGKALKAYLEGNFLSLEKADALLVQNLPALTETLCSLLGDLFYQMGYAADQYPTTQDSLALALARVLGSVNAELFREPEMVETTDMSLIYHLAYMDGTDYITSINAALPAELRFNTQMPVLPLSKSQMAQISEYYARWKAGALRLDDFDIGEYLGDITPLEYLKTVLLVFIADDNRLPDIAAKAIGFELTTERKAALARAVADILDHFNTAPVTAVVRQLSNPDFQAVLKPLLTIAGSVTVRTDYYAYKVFQEGIYADTDGSLLPGVTMGDDGVALYTGPDFISPYMPLIEAVLALLDGSFSELQASVLQTLLESRLEQFKAVVLQSLEVLMSGAGTQRSKYLSDLRSAEIEKRFAEQQLGAIDSGAYQQTLIAVQEQQLKELAEQIAALQVRLAALEAEEAVAKEDARGYYETLAELTASLTEETEEEIINSELYLTAQAHVEAVEASLADNYAEQASCKAQIAEKSAAADACQNEIYRLNHAFYPADAKAVYNRMIRDAEKVIDESNDALSALPDAAADENALAVISSLAAPLLNALDGVYDKLIHESPVIAIMALLYGLKDFSDAVDAIDWEQLSAYTQPLFAEADTMLGEVAGRYIGAGGGENMLADLDAYVNGILEKYGVLNYLDLDSLDTFLSTEILADNSEAMIAASQALAAFFPDVQASYDSIVSCLIPLLSAFNFGEIMNNMNDIGTALSLASPSAFAYLAGMNGAGLDSAYLTTVNQNLASFGYKGEAVTPIISLSSSRRSTLANYVAMEQNGSSLSDIRAAGFVWSDYTGSTSHLTIANALVKIALGDTAKLGEIAAAPGLGKALVNLLCDLLDEIKTAPARTLIKKLSAGEDLSAIAAFVMNLLNGDDPAYMSYDLYFQQGIFEDGDGNPAFYVYIDELGAAKYNGPQTLRFYLPVINAAIDLFNGMDADVERNGGDLLKTLLFEKTAQLKSLVQALIAPTDERGNVEAGLLFYFLPGYQEALKSENSILSYNLLMSLAEAQIASVRENMAKLNVKIELWRHYLDEVHAAEDAMRLAKAKELGVMEESETAFSEEALDAAMEAKIRQAQQDIADLETRIALDQQAILDAQAQVQAVEDAMDELDAKYGELDDNDDLYGYIYDIIDNQDASLLESMRADAVCQTWFDNLFGEGSFDSLVNILEEVYADDGMDAAVFYDDYIYGNRGLNIYEEYETLDAQKGAMTHPQTGVVALANAQLTADTNAKTAKEQELESYQSGTAKTAIMGAAVDEEGKPITFTVSDEMLGVDNAYSAEDIVQIITGLCSFDMPQLEAQIAEKESEIAGYQSECSAIKAAGTSFNMALVPLAAEASEALSQAMIAILSGDQADGSENVYHYIMNRRISAIFTTGGRIQALFEALVALWEPALHALVKEGLLGADTAAQLIAATPTFDAFKATALAAFPTAFLANPVGAVGELIHELSAAVTAQFDEVSGELTHDALQIKQLNKDLMNLFDERFSDDWLRSYTEALVMRTGAIYRVLADLMGLDFVRSLLPGQIATKGVIEGKIDTSKIYSDVTVSLCRGDTVVAQIVITKDSDGSFRFEEVEEGSYEIKLSARAAIPVVIKAVDVLAEGTTDLSDAREDSPAFALPVGDTDGDGVIDLDDVRNVLDIDSYGKDNPACDFNCDGTVDVCDLSILLAEGNYSNETLSV